MSAYDRYKTDPEKESAGVWVEFDGFKMLIARAGGTNKAFLKTLERKTKPYRRAIQNETISIDIADKIVREAYAETVVLGWEGMKDENDKDLPFSKEACLKVLSDLPELFAEVKQAAEKMELFRASALEDEAKN